MSASRSVAAAQRRRAGPSEPQQAVRGPNTSINSSQVFSQQPNQMRPGTTGRLAGQQAALQQQQYLQQQQPQQQNNIAQTSTSKMTIPQAITLITLRLGRLENQLAGSEVNSSSINGSLENALVESILQRLDSLEQYQSDNSELSHVDPVKNSNLEEEIVKIKQQLETCKLGVTSLRSTTTVSSKDLKTFKSELDALKVEFFHTKNLIEDLQLVYDNDNKNESLLEVDYAHNNETLSSHINFQNQNTSSDNELELELDLGLETIVEETKANVNVNEESLDLALVPSENIEESVEPSSLKEIIQQELKQSGVYINEPVVNTNTSKKQGKYNKNHNK